jgi:hypothetical protein
MLRVPKATEKALLGMEELPGCSTRHKMALCHFSVADVDVLFLNMLFHFICICGGCTCQPLALQEF